jgi:ABC-type Fe3+ transport system permease subunit
MKIFPLLIAILTGTLGIYSGVLGFRKFTYMVKNNVSLWFQVKTSLIAGLSGEMLFCSMIMIMAYLDEEYTWTVNSIVDALLISIIPALIIGIGSFIQSTIMTGYKQILGDVLKRRNRTPRDEADKIK